MHVRHSLNFKKNKEMSKVVIIPVSRLTENSVNNKVYNVNDKLFDYFVELIKEFGILEPLIIDNDFNIISGNRRYKAALQLGFDVVPAIFSSTPVSSVSSILHNQQRVKSFSEMMKEFKVLHSKSGTKQGQRTDLKGDKTSLRNKVSKMFGISESQLNRLIKLDKQLNKLFGNDTTSIKKVWDMVDGKSISLNNAIKQSSADKKPKAMKISVKTNRKSKSTKDAVVIPFQPVAPNRSLFPTTPTEQINEIVEKYVQDGRIVYEENSGVITSDLKIFQGSSENMYHLKDNSVQSIITSCPYFQMRTYSNGPNELGREKSVSEFISNLMKIFNECFRVLKTDGSLWVNINDCFDKGCYNMVEAYFKVAMAQNGWMLHDEIIWNKSNPVPVDSPRSQRTHEYIFHFKKSNKIFYNPKWLYEADFHFSGIIYGLNGVQRRIKSAFTLNGNFVNGIIANTSKLRKICKDLGIVSMDHSATFPWEIPYLAVQLTSKPGDIVLDPFSGTGTTGMVALGLGRRYVGYELNTSYIEGSIARLTSFEVIDVAA